MRRISGFYLPAFFLFALTVAAQKKTMQAVFTKEKITIDGAMKENVWNTASVATNFVMFQPDNGKAIPEERKSDVRLLYDNEAIYVFATLNDENPEKIRKELTQRDVVGTADMFGVFINGFNDGQQDFQFFVSASGVQLDRAATEDGQVTPENYSQDFSWDAIWESDIAITATGWNVEIKIPYAALRFSDAAKQTWGVNFFRGIRRDRQNYTWNPVNFEQQSTRTQNGILEGIENIKPPTRLFFIPYTSYYYESGPNGNGGQFKAGLDLKYGINESFTLDAILVPDFGQTRFDNLILNLSPYEQQFTENRPFFTEGVDLFNKGSLFYSRRIGAGPQFGYYNYDSETENLSAPSTVNLLNAIKISGRTKGGLGIGVLNAVTEKTYGTATNAITGEQRSVVVEPLANYSVVVLDKRFNQNSSVTLVNTNVTRDGSYYDANVTGLLFDLNTKENSYNLSGDFKYSHVTANDGYSGFKTGLNFEKTSGKYRYTLFGKYISADYDINDLGYALQTDYHYGYADFSYRILNPTKVFNTFRLDAKSAFEIQNTTGKLQDAFVNVSAGGNSVQNDYYYALLQVNPLETFYFYSYPQSALWYHNIPRNFLANVIFSSNYNRAFALDLSASMKIFDEDSRLLYNYFISPRYRLSNRVSLIYSFEYGKSLHDRGYVPNDFGLLFAERNVKTIVNSLTGKFALNNKMAFNLTARYYSSYSENLEFLDRSDDGYFTPAAFIPDLDENLNIWNVDLTYSWWFAPGSQLSVLYRNNALDSRSYVLRGFNNNLKSVFEDNLNNVFSVSLRYYIDYNSLKKKR